MKHSQGRCMGIDIDTLEAAARATDNESWRQCGHDGREVRTAFDDGADHFIGRMAYPDSAAFIAKVPFYGAAVLCLDDENIQQILPGVNRRVVT